jgi:hypothetical protein
VQNLESPVAAAPVPPAPAIKTNGKHAAVAEEEVPKVCSILDPECEACQ